MAIPIRKLGREEMLKSLATFDQLTRCNTGLPDMDVPEGECTFLNVLGFDQPEDTAYLSPFGDKAPAAITHMRAGFGVSFLECERGKGVLMHNHETVETFMGLKGRWLIEWEGDQGKDSVELKPFDFFACPVGVNRRFECIEPAEGEKVGLLLGIIEGNAPAAEFSVGSWDRINEHRAVQQA